nr:uncharacterized protein LOC113801782 [Penaeus vannamei]
MVFITQNIARDLASCSTPESNRIWRQNHNKVWSFYSLFNSSQVKFLFVWKRVPSPHHIEIKARLQTEPKTRVAMAAASPSSSSHEPQRLLRRPVGRTAHGHGERTVLGPAVAAAGLWLPAGGAAAAPPPPPYIPPYPPLPPPPPRRLHHHPHGHQSLPYMSFREPPPPPPPTGRWDEDPCFLRPHSPETPCPHSHRAEHTPQEDGTCFVVMGSQKPLEIMEPFSAKNPLHVPHLQQEEEGVYSYAGEGILSPADVIRAQAAMEDSDSYGGSLASENIYEEIPENWSGAWSRRSLVEEVLDEYERVRAGHRRVLSALNLDVETLIRPEGHDGTASPDSGLTVSASDSSCEPHAGCDPSRPRTPTNHDDPATSWRSQKKSSPKQNAERQLPKGRGRLVKCESLDLKDAMTRRPSGGRGRGFKEKLGGVKEKMEKKGWRFPNFSRKGASGVGAGHVVSRDAAMPKVPGRRRSLATEREVGPPERESGAREGR